MKKKSRSVKKSGAAAAASPRRSTSTSSAGTTFNQLLMLFFPLLLVNVVVIYVASMLFPMHIVLGTSMLSPLVAAVYSMAVLTLIGTGAMPVIDMMVKQFKLKLEMFHWIGIYLLVNVVGLYGVTRLADMLGLGVTSWVVVVLLAAVLDIAQGLTVQQVLPAPKK